MFIELRDKLINLNNIYWVELSTDLHLGIDGLGSEETIKRLYCTVKINMQGIELEETFTPIDAFCFDGTEKEKWDNLCVYFNKEEMCYANISKL